MRSLNWLVLLLILVGANSARADDDARTTEARHHYEAGMAHYNLEEWDAAIAEFEAGYRLRPSPEFLFNIAQAYRLSNRPSKAVSFFQKYLRMNPDAPNRSEVERLIERAQADAKNEPKPEPKATPPATTAPPSSTSASSSPAASQPATTTSAASTAAANETLTKGPPAKPTYKKAWFWGVLGAAVVVAAGAVVAGVLLSEPGSTKTLPVARF